MVRTKRRSQRQRQRTHRGGGGSIFATDNYGEGKTLMRSAFDTVREQGSNLTNAVRNKVGSLLNKQPVIREEKEEYMGNREDTDTDSFDPTEARNKASNFYAASYKKRNEKRAMKNTWSGQRGGRSKKRGKITHRKTKRRRH